MKKLLSIVTLASLIVIAAPFAQAQRPPMQRGDQRPEQYPEQTSTPGSSYASSYAWMSIQGGGVFPNGDFDDVADNGLGIGASLGLFVNPMVLVKGSASYYSFGTEEDSAEEYDGGYVPLEIGTNIYLGYFGNVRPYATLHGGWYVATGDFDDFDSGFGIGFGPGIDIPMGSPNTSLFIEPSYNIIFNGDDNGFDEDFDFWGLQIGFSFTMLPQNPFQN